MFRYRIRTHIDITRSKAGRESSDELAIGQQSNFNTFLQGIGLRANIQWDQDPVNNDDQWEWEFVVEQALLFDDGNSPVGLLLEDLNGIPIISNLSNTRAIYPPVIRTLGDDVNTWVEYIPSNS